MAEPGWYPLSSDPTMVAYYDGTQWVGGPVPAPSQMVPAPPAEPAQPVAEATSLGTVLTDLVEKAGGVARDKEHQGTAMAAAGGAVLADSVVGLRKNGGIGGAITTIVFGVLFALGTGMFLDSFAPLSAPQPRAGEITTSEVIVGHDYTTGESSYCIPLVILDGNVQQAKPSVYVSPCPTQEGQQIEVQHIPGKEGSARVAGDAATGVLGGFRLMFVGAGVLVAVGGVFSLLKRLGLAAGGGWLLWKGLQRRRDARAAKRAGTVTADTTSPGESDAD